MYWLIYQKTIIEIKKHIFSSGSYERFKYGKFPKVFVIALVQSMIYEFFYPHAVSAAFISGEVAGYCF